MENLNKFPNNEYIQAAGTFTLLMDPDGAFVGFCPNLGSVSPNTKGGARQSLIISGILGAIPVPRSHSYNFNRFMTHY